MLICMIKKVLFFISYNVYVQPSKNKKNLNFLFVNIVNKNNNNIFSSTFNINSSILNSYLNYNQYKSINLISKKNSRKTPAIIFYGY